jgi:hypothetical protein
VKAYPALGYGNASWPVLLKAYTAYNGSKMQVQGLVEVTPTRALVSFAIDKGQNFTRYVAECGIPDEGMDVMLDSGAFSVWTKGSTVDIDDYLRWIEHVRRSVGDVQVINLDVIPGSPLGGTRPSLSERSSAIAESLKNADRLRSEDVKVMEVFHLHEPIDVFELLLERRQPGEVLALGGLAGKGNAGDKQPFCDAAFATVRDRVGGWANGIVRLHGLGISPDAPLCARYPWWSVDSSSWSIFHRYGAEVRRDGRLQKPSSSFGSPGRSIGGQRSAGDLYYIRTLKRWRRLEDVYTRLWQDRGVRYDEDTVAV